MAKEKVVYSCISSDGKVIRWSCDPTDLDDRPTTYTYDRSEQAFNARTIYTTHHNGIFGIKLISCFYKGYDHYQHVQHKVSEDCNLVHWDDFYNGGNYVEKFDDEAFFNFLIKDDE